MKWSGKCWRGRSTDRLFYSLSVSLGRRAGEEVTSDPVFCELECGPAAALALVMRPLNRLPLQFRCHLNLDIALTCLTLNTKLDRIEIAILGEGIEGDP